MDPDAIQVQRHERPPGEAEHLQKDFPAVSEPYHHRQDEVGKRLYLSAERPSGQPGDRRIFHQRAHWRGIPHRRERAIRPGI